MRPHTRACARGLSRSTCGEPRRIEAGRVRSVGPALRSTLAPDIPHLFPTKEKSRLAAALSHCSNWRPHGDSNPGYCRERAVS